jgi:hypothetical protein
LHFVLFFFFLCFLFCIVLDLFFSGESPNAG